MDGRYKKIKITPDAFSKCGGILCNKNHKYLAYQAMQSKFGKPNANCLRTDESTWKYLLEYQNSYITIYDYNQFWSIGFAEKKNQIADYKVIYMIVKMFYQYIKDEIMAVHHLDMDFENTTTTTTTQKL